jgi:hypothetical protein
MELASVFRIGTGKHPLQPDKTSPHRLIFSGGSLFRRSPLLFSNRSIDMNTQVTLSSLEMGLREPFALQEIKFLPKSPSNKNGSWTCLALPYCDKRVYEDRLNDLVFDDWSTLSPSTSIAGNKLIIAVTLVLCGVARTDFGEAFLSSSTRNGDTREEENSATEAYSQAFRRVCAQFRLGRYLYTLPKVWVAYDPAKRAIALSDAEKLQQAEHLYRQAGLLPAPQAQAPASSDHSVSSTSEAQEQVDQPSVDYINERQLIWVRKHLQNDPARIQRICTHYKVASLEQLTSAQTTNLLDKLLSQTGKGTMRQQVHS